MFAQLFEAYTNDICKGKNHHPYNIKRINTTLYNGKPLITYLCEKIGVCNVKSVYDIVDSEHISLLSNEIKKIGVFASSNNSPCSTLNKYIAFLNSLNIKEKTKVVEECEYVYCFSNPSFKDGIYKIGKTKNINDRLKQLDNTSTPLPFKCEFAIETYEADKIEKALHSYFEAHTNKVRRTREYFFCDDKNFIFDSFKLIVRTNCKTLLLDNNLKPIAV